MPSGICRKGVKTILLADRGFIHTDAMSAIRRLGWHYRIRLKCLPISNKRRIFWRNYAAGTWGPQAAAALLGNDGREWRSYPLK